MKPLHLVIFVAHKLFLFFLFFIGNYYDFELLCVEQELDHEVCDPILVYYLHDVNLIKLKISGVLEIIF